MRAHTKFFYIFQNSSESERTQKDEWSEAGGMRHSCGKAAHTFPYLFSKQKEKNRVIKDLFSFCYVPSAGLLTVQLAVTPGFQHTLWKSWMGFKDADIAPCPWRIISH